MATYLLRNRVALLRVAAPPVNSLGLAARKGIADGLLRAKADNASAVVLAGEGRTFPAGADIAEFAAGGHLTSPTLGDLIEQLVAPAQRTEEKGWSSLLPARRWQARC